MDDTEYLKINDAVNKVFFDGRCRGLPVYLDLEDNSSEELASILGEDNAEIEDYIGLVVAETLCWDQANAYCYHLRNLKLWQDCTSSEPPPMSALLLTFSLAAEHMRKGEDYSANNYYQRLSEVLCINDEEGKSKLRASSRYMLVFWKALNRWLMDADYAYGRPTASQVNSWTYVSYALSQSLVRDADRKRFHKMFSDYGLSPHENLSESEVMLYLNEWMAGYGASGWLKKLWSVPDLRERIAGAALQELECCYGGEDQQENDMPVYTRLSWAVVIKKFPRKKISFYLTANGRDNEGVELSPWMEDGNTCDAFKGREEFWLTALQGTEMVYLEPIDAMSLDALFLSSFGLEDGARCRKYRHEASAVIPLVKQDGSPVYREVSRISLYGSHHVLCHRNWKDRVDAYLEEYARPGYEIIDGSSSPYLPSQWVLFQGVEVISIPREIVNNNLQCLVPLSTGLTMYMSGGLKLAPSIWHAKSPPEIFVSDEDGLLNVQLREEKLDKRGKVICEADASSYQPDFLYSHLDKLDANNLVVVAVKKMKVKAEKDISFRSALTPRKQLPGHDVDLAYVLDVDKGGRGGFSCSPSDELLEGSLSLKGMILIGNPPALSEINIPEKYQSLGINYREDDTGTYYDVADVEGAAESCILRGYHYWICELDSSSMTCRDCQRFQLARKKSKKKKKKKSAVSVEHSRKMPAPIIAQRTGGSISPDIVYDAICYRGAGTWSELQSIVSVLVEQPWDLAAVTRNLVDLGLVDIMLDNTCLKPSRWSCPPPALVIDSGGNAFLSGFRNDELVARMEELLSGVAKAHCVEEQDMAPLAHLWELENVSIEELEALINDLRDPHGRKMRVVKAPGESIVIAMPTMGDAIEYMNPVHIEDNGDIERFDPRTGKWKSAALDGAGAYRTFYAGRRYFYHNADRVSRQGSFEMVKLLAGRDEGVYLHGYDSVSGCFESVIGIEPPGLYRRALVSCSGILPKKENGKLIYSGVPMSLSSLLMFKLYE